MSCQLHQWIDLIFGYKQKGKLDYFLEERKKENKKKGVVEMGKILNQKKKKERWKKREEDESKPDEIQVANLKLIFPREDSHGIDTTSAQWRDP